MNTIDASYIPGDPKNGFYDFKVKLHGQNFIFLNGSKNKRTALSARYFWLLKRSKTLFFDRELWDFVDVNDSPFFGGSPGTMCS